MYQLKHHQSIFSHDILLLLHIIIYYIPTGDAAGEGCDANKHSAILEQQTSVFEEDSRVFRYNWFTTYAFDEGGFKDGALNVPNYEEVGPGQACPNIKWIAGIFETRGWGVSAII